MFFAFHRRPSALLIVAIATTTGRPAAAQGGVSTGIELRPITYVPGDIRSSELGAVASRVHTLRVESPLAALRVGDTLSLDTVVVAAYDSAGIRIGRLRTFDMSSPPGAVANVGRRQLLARRAGTTDIVIRFPRVAWRGRDDELVSVTVSVRVADDR
jgi:hypothetical protein